MVKVFSLKNNHWCYGLSYSIHTTKDCDLVFLSGYSIAHFRLSTLIFVTMLVGWGLRGIPLSSMLYIWAGVFMLFQGFFNKVEMLLYRLFVSMQTWAVGFPCHSANWDDLSWNLLYQPSVTLSPQRTFMPSAIFSSNNFTSFLVFPYPMLAASMRWFALLLHGSYHGLIIPLFSCSSQQGLTLIGAIFASLLDTLP